LEATKPSVSTTYRRRRWRWIDIQEQLTGFLFVAPAIIVISIFGLFPIFYAFYMSTFRWRVRKTKFLGLGNYAKAVGDGQGVAVFVLGFLFLALAYWIWT